MNQSTSQAIVPANIWLLLSLCTATLLEIYPLPVATNLWRPQWLLLAITLWALRRPLEYGIVTGFVAGLLLDIAVGGVLGRHALTLCLCMYLLKSLQQRLHHSTVLHQSLLVFGLALFNVMLLNGIDQLVLSISAMGQLPLHSALATALLWPLLQLTTRRFLNAE